MKKFDKVIWAVKTSVWGANKPFDKLFEKYENALIESQKDYRDKPKRRFITNEEYNELKRIGAFDDWRVEENE